MTDISENVNTLGEAFKRKPTAFLLLGVLLMIASMYINSLKEGAGDIGVYYSKIIIALALIAQAISWIFYFFINRNNKKNKK
jgi:uncharacterized membrane protein HdeD (DUF308 family)